MTRWTKAGAYRLVASGGKDPLAPQPRDAIVEPLNVGESSAQHDHIRIEKIDDAGEGARHASFVARQRLCRGGITFSGARHDVARLAGQTGAARVFAFEPGPRQEGLDAAVLPAVARRPWSLLIARPRQRVVAPLPRDRIRPGEDTAVHGDAAAGAGPDDHAEDHVGARSRAVRGFRHGETVGVVGDAYVTAQAVPQVIEERLADQPDGVGVLDEPGRRRECAGNADADRRRPAGVAFERSDQRGDRTDGSGVIVAGGVETQARDLATAIDRNAFDFRPAQIDSDAKRHLVEELSRSLISSRA